MHLRERLPLVRGAAGRAKRSREGSSADNPGSSRSEPTRMSLTDPFAHLTALRPARKRGPIEAQAESLPAASDRLAQLLGAEARRNHYGEHLSLQEWFATPEMCRPDPRAL